MQPFDDPLYSTGYSPTAAYNNWAAAATCKMTSMASKPSSFAWPPSVVSSQSAPPSAPTAPCPYAAPPPPYLPAYAAGRDQCTADSLTTLRLKAKEPFPYPPSGPPGRQLPSNCQYTPVGMPGAQG